MQFSVEIIDNINKMLIVLDNDDELYVFPLSKAELIFENINENIDVISFDLQSGHLLYSLSGLSHKKPHFSHL